MKKTRKSNSNRGGFRPNSGRRRLKEDERNIPISGSVPESVVSRVREEAEAEGISISMKLTNILADWASQPEIPDPEETPLDTAAKFLVAILRRAVEMMDEERREKEEN